MRTNFTALPSPAGRTGASCALIGLVMALSGCNDGDDRSGMTFEDFQGRVRTDAGRDAESCGEVSIGQSRLEADTCLARAFGNGTDAYAVFRQQGIDSTIIAATVVRDGEVTFYSFDSDPTGGGAPDNGRVSSRPCLEPTLSGSLEGGLAFRCGGSDPSAPIIAPASPFDGVTWLWSGYRTSPEDDVVDVSPEPLYSLRFSTDSRVDGYLSCNALSGVWTSDGTELTITDLSTDDEVCPTAVNNGPSYDLTLSGTSTFVHDGLQLSIVSESGTTLIFSQGVDEHGQSCRGRTALC